MKFNLLALMMICLLSSNCKYKPKTNQTSNKNILKPILNIETDSCKVTIAEVNISDYRSFSNSHYTSPYLEIEAECMPLIELLGIIKSIDVNSIILNNKDLENKFYSVLVNQKLSNSQQDSIIKNRIIESLNVALEKKMFNIDIVSVSIDNKSKLLEYVNSSVKDTIISKSNLSRDSLIFENCELDKVLASVGKEYDKTLILGSDESMRINISLKRSDWKSTMTQLEKDLGLSFNIKTTPEEKYWVR